MRFPKTHHLRRTVCTAALVLLASTTAVGEQLVVSATVLKHAALTVLSQPSTLVLTAADISRGYVEVPIPAEMAVRSNSPAGYLLNFSSEAEYVRQIVIRGLATEVQLSPFGGAVMQAGQSSSVTKDTLALRFRFVLTETARPGVFSWPVRISVTPV